MDPQSVAVAFDVLGVPLAQRYGFILQHELIARFAERLAGSLGRDAAPKAMLALKGEIPILGKVLR